MRTKYHKSSILFLWLTPSSLSPTSSQLLRSKCWGLTTPLPKTHWEGERPLGSRKTRDCLFHRSNGSKQLYAGVQLSDTPASWSASDLASYRAMMGPGKWRGSVDLSLINWKTSFSYTTKEALLAPCHGIAIKGSSTLKKCAENSSTD